MVIDFILNALYYYSHMLGTLSIVATPIGNMEDITLRALRTLREADYVLAEDTRMTGKLLKHHSIEQKLKRYDVHASDALHHVVLQDLRGGKHIALVSDAGTPGVSDPGVMLVARARALSREAGTDIHIETIPGPSAVTAAFSIAGISGNQFTFLGFVPQKKGRETFFKNLTTVEYAAIFFESTHRIMKTLEALSAHLPKEWQVSVARELTKIHEEFIKDTAENVLQYFLENPVHQKGEFVLIVDPNTHTL